MDLQKMQQLQKDPIFQEKISRRAYELFIKRGGQLGHEAEDWFQAETELCHSIATKEQTMLATPQMMATPIADTITGTVSEKSEAKPTSKVAKQELTTPVKAESKKAASPKKAGSKTKSSKKFIETTA